MKIEDIENTLSNYLNIYIEDLIANFNNIKENRDLVNMNIISLENIDEISFDELSEIIQILNSLRRLDEINLNQLKESIDDNLKYRVNKELGPNNNDNEVIEQVLSFYKSRILIMMMTKYSKYFTRNNYDIFLSHSSLDTREVVGLKLLLLFDHGLTSYVDWLDDYELDYFRATKKIVSVFLENLNKKDAFILRDLEYFFERQNIRKKYTTDGIVRNILTALETSDEFIYLDSKHSRFSKWMPYELGYAKAKLDKKMYRIIVNYKRNRKGSIKYSSFLEELHIINNIDKEISLIKSNKYSV